jgi:enoyl-[acyl-carrier protein] reductase I
MAGKTVLVTGARNKWSIAWHSARSLIREGANVIFSVYGDREEGAVKKLLDEMAVSATILQCDATSDESIAALFEAVSERSGGKLDGLVHAMAFAQREELTGEFVATSRDGFVLAGNSSAYSLVALTRAARPLMAAAGGGSVVTLTYLGSERVVPNYNVMGVAKASLEACVRYLASDLGQENTRVNAVSAGPIKTLASSGIAGLDTMLKRVADASPLRRNVQADEVGDTVLFLLSPWSRGITGEVIYVDGGYHIMGML